MGQSTRIGPVVERAPTLVIKRDSICAKDFRSLQPRRFPFVGLPRNCSGFFQEIPMSEICVRVASTSGRNGLTKITQENSAERLGTWGQVMVISGVHSEATTRGKMARTTLR